MSQKTNLNINPYYDDYNSEKNFYKVLFKPGFPVQARELTTLQSLLQGQVESFGSHIFKEGSVVVPGNISYDNQFYSVKLNATSSGIDVALYIENFIGKKIVGESSGTTAKIQRVEFADDNNFESLTIYVKYLDSDNDFEFTPFEDGESLSCVDSVTYGNTTIPAGTEFASLISSDATAIGSAASIGKGIYFIRGYFVNVSKQTILLDNYTNTPSYRVGLKIDELIIGSKDDESLFDNAKGFTNFAAPGADRFKINLTLTKKLLSDTNDTDFVELLRLKNGKIQKITTKTQYNQIRDYMAERTYDESGDYAVEPFDPSVHNSLNNRLGNNGLFFSNELTEERNVPSEDLMCFKISPGKAYVRGYDVEKTGTTIIDVEKPRDTQKESNVTIPFEMGNLLRVNNVTGVPQNKATIKLYNRKVGDSGAQIGDARVYTFNLTDAAYSGAATKYDLRLYDVQTYTKITLNKDVDATDMPDGSYIKGKSSGASGYLVDAGGGTEFINLRGTSGSFAKGEQITVNGVDFPRTIREFVEYGTQNIKSVRQEAGGNFPLFTADSVLEKFRMPNGIDQINIPAVLSGVATATAAGKVFSGIRTDTIISYQRSGFSTETFNRVSSVSADGLSIELSPIASGAGVTSVYDGAVLTGSNDILVTPFPRGPIIDAENGYLFSQLPDINISSVDLLNSTFTIVEQITEGETSGAGELTFNLSSISGITSASFATFDQERYGVHYSTGIAGTITDDAFDLTNNIVTIRGLRPSQNNVVINTTLTKFGVQSKIKKYNRSQTLNITRSKYSDSGVGINTSNNDGLNFNTQYGLRVQDEEISLNYPDVAKVIVIYESLGTGNPTLDRFQFTSTASVQTNAIIGENVVGNSGNAIARVVSSPSANNLELVYLTNDVFSVGETVTFQESNIVTEVESITLGSYKDVTQLFKLDKGQKDEYYDYSRIVRNKNVSEPTRRLLVVFDYYSVPSDDNGDAFTVLSYDEERFAQDIPNIGRYKIRASDTLDFRPRVSVFDPTTATVSPFDFSSRSFDSVPKLLMAPGEGSILGYEYYLPRIDKLYLDRYGSFIVEKGVSSKYPKAPTKNDALLEIATINLPPFLYTPQNASITLIDNRRFTMRDIGNIEDRVENLERITSLSLLELNTQTLQIRDADGRNRFKSGFFVDDFKNYSLIDRPLSSIQINPTAEELIPIISRNSIKSQIVLSDNITPQSVDFTDNADLLDPNVQKTGNSVTLRYDEIDWIEQPIATTVENVNPFNVVVYTGNIELNPAVDTWVRTIQLPDRSIRTSTNRSRTLTQNLTSSINLNLGTAQIQGQTTNVRVGRQDGGVLTRTSTRTTTRNRNLSASSSSFDSSTTVDTISFDDISIRNEHISSSDETFMRSRNTEFLISNLKPSTRFYQFLDGNSGVDFIPKLIEISNSTSLENYGTAEGSFQIGETVVGSAIGAGGIGPSISFRVATPNHKFGIFNNPSSIYNINPYIISESIPSAYSQSSKILNVDTASLSEEAQGLYSGYLIKGMKLVGQTSGAIAYVKDLRLISDNYGDLNGAFFIRDPNAIPVPSVRLQTGTKTFKITSSASNDPGLPGSNTVSFAESNYSSTGSLEQWQNEVTTRTDNLTTTSTINLRTQASASLTISQVDTEVREEYGDPLAQTFVVGGNVEAPSDIDTSDDINGAFLTAVDLFFAKIDQGNAPVKVQIRTTELGFPTRTILGKTVTIRPTTVDSNGNIIKNIEVSNTGDIATKVTFPEPIFLAPGKEYAVVILAETSDEYEVWTATMGETSVASDEIPPNSNAESAVYSRQFALGSLFKSQNGSIWTPNQYQDLKFKLYKAEFTSNTGTVFFYNPTLDKSNDYVSKLSIDPIRTLSKTGTIGITTVSGSSANIGILTTGRKLAGANNTNGSAIVVGRGSSVTSLAVPEGGTGYVVDSSVETFNVVGSGSGLKLNISSINANTGAITGISAASAKEDRGNGYKVGDVVGVVTSTVSSSTGRDARITITGISTDVDTLYVSNVQGEFGSNGSGKAFAVGAGISYFADDGTLTSIATNDIRTATGTGGVNAGNHMRVNHFNHGMYSNTNKVILSDVQSNVEPTTLSAALSVSEVSSVSVANTSNFTTFEGVEVSASNPGYIKINNEIITYNDVGSGSLTIASDGRATDSTIAELHEIGNIVYKYELNGISLRRVNKTHTIAEPIGIDDYHIIVDRSANGVDRSVDGTPTGMPQLNFSSEASTGSNNCRATENIMFDSIIPTYNIITPGSSTFINGTIRTISGTSVDGTESSFNDEGFEPVGINVLNTLNSPRIVCSKVNEDQFLSNLPRGKSFTTGITLNSNDSNLSPQINLDTAFTEFRSSRFNKPITDYASDGRVKSIFNDPHSAVYVSNTIFLANPATSLKVILSAYRDQSADFRVLYNLIRSDSGQVDQTFELFPGYDNVTYTDDDGFSVVDASKNSGLPDKFVPASLDNEFLEYEFTANELPLFTGYTIKIVMSGTNQAHPPRISELRTIAVR